jgi:hypothetical protein
MAWRSLFVLATGVPFGRGACPRAAASRREPFCRSPRFSSMIWLRLVNLLRRRDDRNGFAFAFSRFDILPIEVLRVLRTLLTMFEVGLLLHFSS